MNEGKMGRREMWVDSGELRQAGKKKVCCIHSNSVSSLYGETNKENICLQTPNATSVYVYVCVCVCVCVLTFSAVCVLHIIISVCLCAVSACLSAAVC